jgi:hypothetical protein
MSLLYRSGALLIKAGLGLVRATGDCLTACCRPFYCCQGSGAPSCQQDPCPTGEIQTGPYATLQECEEDCGSGPPDVYYCCWDDETQQSSTCYTTPCGEGLYRSGPYPFLNDCQDYCSLGACCPPPEAESPYCYQTSEAECANDYGTFALNQTCQQTACPTDCYGGHYPSPCGGVALLPPLTWCDPPGPRCSPAVNATISVSGVDCYRDPSGNCDIPGLQALVDAVNSTFILDDTGVGCMGDISVTIYINGTPYTIFVRVVRSLAASPPAAANTVCHKVQVNVVASPAGCGYGSTVSESANNCAVLPLTLTEACTCVKRYDCEFSASGPLIPYLGPCAGYLLDFSNAQYSLVIA